jgi:hypothetical protein
MRGGTYRHTDWWEEFLAYFPYFEIIIYFLLLLSSSSLLSYIYKSESGWLAGRVCVHVAKRPWAVAMQRGRFLWGPFWGQRHLLYILLLLCSEGVFFGVCSGSITWQRHLYKIEPFLWGMFWGCCLATTIVRWCFLFGPVVGQRHNNCKL